MLIAHIGPLRLVQTALAQRPEVDKTLACVNTIGNLLIGDQRLHSVVTFLFLSFFACSLPLFPPQHT